MPFVVAAEELTFLAVLANQQQQVPLRGLNVEHVDIGIRSRPLGNLKELAIAVVPDVERDDAPDVTVHQPTTFNASTRLVR
ncbi:MAG TPA: hypothetical protein VND64_02490 [Pirellulales bacterium]|nr:hypothetical protein [Pirellulales bacterium]